jgi:hypothetical protein
MLASIVQALLPVAFVVFLGWLAAVLKAAFGYYHRSNHRSDGWINLAGVMNRTRSNFTDHLQR